MQEICASTAPVLAAPAAGGKEQLVGPEMAAAAEAMAQSTNAVLRIFVAITAINEPGRAPADAGFKLLAGCPGRGLSSAVAPRAGSIPRARV